MRLIDVTLDQLVNKLITSFDLAKDGLIDAIADRVADRIAERRDPLLKAPELAKALGVSEATVTRLKKTGAIPYYADSEKSPTVRYKLGDVEDALRRRDNGRCR